MYSILQRSRSEAGSYQFFFCSMQPVLNISTCKEKKKKITQMPFVYKWTCSNNTNNFYLWCLPLVTNYGQKVVKSPEASGRRNVKIVFFEKTNPCVRLFTRIKGARRIELHSLAKETNCFTVKESINKSFWEDYVHTSPFQVVWKRKMSLIDLGWSWLVFSLMPVITWLLKIPPIPPPAARRVWRILSPCFRTRILREVHASFLVNRLEIRLAPTFT